jgi:hypothetical protein
MTSVILGTIETPPIRWLLFTPQPPTKAKAKTGAGLRPVVEDETPIEQVAVACHKAV